MRALAFAFLIALSGCSYLNPANWHPYHMDIQQGNLITQDDIARLKLGMTRSQVRFVLGTPLITDPFHADRWDYKYQLFQNGKKVADKLITLTFTGDTLSKIDGEAMPPAVPIPIVPLNASAPAASAQATEAHP